MVSVWVGCLIVLLQRQYWSVDFICGVEVFVSVMPLCGATAVGYVDTIEKELYCLSSSQMTSLITVGATSKIYAEFEMMQKF
jgi:hypothetical protein